MSEAINRGGKIHYYNCIELREGGEKEGRKEGCIDGLKKKGKKMSGTEGGRRQRAARDAGMK